MKARVALAAALVALVFAVAIARQFSIGAEAMRDSDSAMQRGDFVAAIDHARLAAEARALGSPYPERGYERLLAVAQRGDPALSARAYRAIRAAAFSSRALGSSGADEHVRTAERELSRLEPAKAAALPTSAPPAMVSYAALGLAALVLYGGLVLAVRKLR